MPVFNGGPYLSTAIESVLAQTFADYELIIVDDGSTDGSDEVIATLAARDPRIRAFRKANSGISDTLNRGLAEARGDWIARLDADDVMLPRRLERQIAFVSADSEIVAAGSYYDIIDSAGARCATLRPLPRDRDELQRFLDLPHDDLPASHRGGARRLPPELRAVRGHRALRPDAGDERRHPDSAGDSDPLPRAQWRDLPAPCG
jgi:glycosyltransferase involved in cell wall biosynthesis